MLLGAIEAMITIKAEREKNAKKIRKTRKQESLHANIQTTDKWVTVSALMSVDRGC